MKASYYPAVQIAVERSLPRNLFVSVAYDVTRGIKPDRVRDINAPLPETGVRPFPNEGQILQLQGSGLSTHQHLKATLRQRFSIFNVSASYAYYHGFSDQGVGSGGAALPSDNYNFHQEWGNTANPRHTVNASLNSRLPLDVYLTTVVTAKSGTFYNITTGKDDNKDGTINDRPAGVSKFTGLGPHYFDVGFNFSKAFELKHAAAATPQRGSTSAGSGPQMNVFANLNNAFNMTHPGTPSGVMTSPFFGRSFNATSPRTIEVGMRFQF
jgi:hypothetical protein